MLPAALISERITGLQLEITAGFRRAADLHLAEIAGSPAGPAVEFAGGMSL